MPASHMGTDAILTAQFPILGQLSVNAPGKVREDNPNSWASTIHVGNLKGGPGFWLQPGLDLAITASWEVSQQIHSLSPRSPSCNSPFQINKPSENKIKIELAYYSAILLLDTLSKGNESHVLKSYLPAQLHCILIHNTQNMKSTQSIHNDLYVYTEEYIQP